MRVEALWAARLKGLIGRLDLYPLTSTVRGRPLFYFARGLIFSSYLIEEIIRDLSSQYSVGWGQIMLEDGALSPEIDIIIYVGKPYHVWETRIMCFTIVPKEQAKVAIECRMNFQINEEIRKKSYELSKFVPEKYFFGECLWSKEKKAGEEIRQKLIEVGYDDAFYLYQYHYVMDAKQLNEEGWFRFLKIIRGL